MLMVGGWGCPWGNISGMWHETERELQMSNLALEVHGAFQARKLTPTKAKDRLELSLSEEQKSSSVNSAARLATKLIFHKNRIYAKMLVF